MAIGDVVEGTVKFVQPVGVFVDMDHGGTGLVEMVNTYDARE